MNRRRPSVSRTTKANNYPNDLAGMVGRATNAGPIEEVRAANSALRHPERNGLISRAEMIEDRRAIAIDPIARVAQTCSVVNIAKMGAIIVRRLKNRCRRSR
jgi:hypothetical protein